MVKVDKNIKIDFYNQEWAPLLDQAAYRGYHVSDLLSAIEKAEAKGEPIAIGYKSTGKAIHLTFGKHKLRLERIVKKKTPFTFSRLWHQIKMGCSQSYADKHQARVERLAGLIQEKLKLDKIDEENIPLINAIKGRDLAKVQELITAGANVNITDKDGRSPLMYAAWKKESEIAHALLAAGAAVKGVKDNFESTPLMFASQAGDMDIVSAMLFKDAEINEKNKEGVTPLLFAIESGNIKLIAKLIEMGADVGVKDNRGYTPLIAAAVNGKAPIEIIDLLIEKGVDINAISTTKANVFTYFMVAKQESNILQHLIDNHLEKLSADNLYNVLRDTVRFNKFEEFKRILPRIQNLDVVKGEESPLHIAVRKGQIEFVSALIEAGADVNCKTANGIPPLFGLEKSGNIEILQKLIDSGADLLLHGSQGETVVDLIKAFRHENSKQLLRLIYANAPELKMRGKEYKYRKQLAHAWHIDGKTNLPIRETSSEVPLTGGSEFAWFHQMTKHLEKFSNAYPEKLEIAGLLENAFEWAKHQGQYSDEQIVERIQSGLPTFLFAGYKKHAVVLFIWKNQVVICNRGAYSTGPVKIETFNPETLTKDAIKRIRDVKQAEAAAYKKLRDDELPTLIKGAQTELDKALESAAELAKQSVGNCSWVSSITAIYAMMLLSGVRGQADGKLLDEPLDEATQNARIQKSVDDYRFWIGFQQLESIEQMMKLIPDGRSTFAPDHDLIQRAFEKAHLTGFDPVLSEKLAASTEVYVASLQEPEKSAFQNKLQEWKAKRELNPLPIIL